MEFVFIVQCTIQMWRKRGARARASKTGEKQCDKNGKGGGYRGKPEM